MALRKYKPTTPSLRGTIKVNSKAKLTGVSPCKELTKGKSKTGGRNNLGRITVRHIGGGAKKLYRVVDFKRNKLDLLAVVQSIEYDPNRTCFIALVKYEDDGVLSYIICPEGLSVGQKIISSANSVDINVGNSLLLKNIPVGTIIHNVEMKPKKGGQIARSAGSFAQLIGKSSGYAQIKMSSGQIRLVNLECMATIGSVSNSDHQNIKIGKAGANVWRGKRPTVRGVAMNPVDHPHGGGEGKTSGGRHPVTPWGKSTKGKKTRKNKFTAKFNIGRKI